MKADLIIEYQKWAQRGYVTALTCKNHTFHDLLVLQHLDGISLVCPRGDYSRDLGLSDYLAIKRKVEMAEMLWRIRS